MYSTTTIKIQKCVTIILKAPLCHANLPLKRCLFSNLPSSLCQSDVFQVSGEAGNHSSSKEAYLVNATQSVIDAPDTIPQHIPEPKILYGTQ